MANRTMGGDPPTAAQYNYGRQYEEIIKEGLLNDLNDVATKGNWDKLLPEKIKNAVKVNGKYYAVPVNLHNENWVWFNKAVLAKAGAKEPTNLDEMFAAMRKTAMSSIIYEVLDMGTGVLDGRGGLVCSGAGIPAFVGVLDKAARALADKFQGPGQIEPGDVFATNDPYFGGVTHLNDIVVAMPVFADGSIVAYEWTFGDGTVAAGTPVFAVKGETLEEYWDYVVRIFDREKAGDGRDRQEGAEDDGQSRAGA